MYIPVLRVIGLPVVALMVLAGWSGIHVLVAVAALTPAVQDAANERIVMLELKGRRTRHPRPVVVGVLGALLLTGGAAVQAQAAVASAPNPARGRGMSVSEHPGDHSEHGGDHSEHGGDHQGPTCSTGLITHVFAAGGALTGPDDITRLGDSIFVAYQNGVGSQGEPSTSGHTQSTVVQYSRSGRSMARWQLTGKVDGMAADREHHRVVATVNEDGASSIFTITPRAGSGVLHHYTYSPNPLPHGGGTDSIAVVNGALLVTASAPTAAADGTTFSGAALYTVTLKAGSAQARPVLMDNAKAIDAVTGKPTILNLSDPDSSTLLPKATPRFGGQLMLDSQGDSQEVFIAHAGRSNQHVTVLNLNTQVDDSAVATAPCGTLFVTDPGKNQILTLTGHFTPGQVFTSVPSDSTLLPATLATLNLRTGTVSPFSKAFTNPKGLLFLPNDKADERD